MVTNNQKPQGCSRTDEHMCYRGSSKRINEGVRRLAESCTVYGQFREAAESTLLGS